MRSKNLLPYIISVLLLTAVLILNQQTFNEMKHYTEQVDHTRIVLNLLSKVSDHLKSAEIFTTDLDQQYKQYYKLYKLEALAVDTELKQLINEVKDNRQQTTRIMKIDTMIRAQLPVLIQRSMAGVIESGEAWRLSELFRIHALINVTSEVEVSLLNERKKKLNEYTNQTQTVTTIFSIIAFGITISSFIYSIFLARKRQWLEGFLESILNTTQNGILYFKARRTHGNITDFEVTFANTATEKHLTNTQSTIKGRKFSDLHLMGKESEIYKKFIRVMETHEPVEFEWKYVQNKKEVWLYIILAKLEDGLTATLQNITEIRQYQNELTRNIQDLETSNRELEQYAYVASHDLQEPLRKIRTYGTFLHERQNERLDENGKIHLGKIIMAAERLSLLIKDILNFSSLRREQVFVPTNLNDVLKNVLEDIDVSIEQNRVVMNTGELPVIEAIPLQINQLFYNLVTNAVKFSAKKEQSVINISSRTITSEEVKLLSKLNPEKAYCEIKIEDNGIGFNEAFSHNIFGLFKRLNDQTAYPGSGIGLALCSKVILNHGGEIFARSIEGEGSRFYVVLPFKQ